MSWIFIESHSNLHLMVLNLFFFQISLVAKLHLSAKHFTQSNLPMETQIKWKISNLITWSRNILYFSNSLEISKNKINFICERNGMFLTKSSRLHRSRMSKSTCIRPGSHLRLSSGSLICLKLGTNAGNTKQHYPPLQVSKPSYHCIILLTGYIRLQCCNYYHLP